MECCVQCDYRVDEVAEGPRWALFYQPPKVAILS